jgi:N-carbamoylputrescine amidase
MPVCAFVEMPDGLEPRGGAWDHFAGTVASSRPDILVMNEMPFGRWLAQKTKFSIEDATRSIEIHDAGTAALAALNLPAIITSRPTMRSDRLVNEAILIEHGKIRSLHTKSYFPEEPGWFEASWFSRGEADFDIYSICGLNVGVLICTELMFNEHARRYGRDGADLIVVPRATGAAHEHWITAGKMASIVSGSYVVSSNRVGHLEDGPRFGGRGFAIGPEGNLIELTASDSPIGLFEIDAQLSAHQRQEYPCYVAELP